MSILVLNSKTLEENITTIREHLQKNSNFVVFIEVTNQKVISNFSSNFSTYFFDPQHTVTGRGGRPEVLKRSDEMNGMSAILYTFVNSDHLSQEFWNKNILYVLEKVDMDSLGALVLCEWITYETEFYKIPVLDLSTETETRIQSIHEVDCFVQPNEWNPDFIQSYEVKWTNILGASISDFSVPIEDRVGYMIDFLTEGKLQEKYRLQVEKEWQLLKQATIETISGITVVTSQARGASGLVYKQAPYGIAYCQNFSGKGAKFSIMEFQGGKYLDLTGFFAHMNENFPESSGTWGGNVKAGVGGSPIPCSLSKELVAAELAKFVL
jgi:hypothetical protein